MEDQTKVSMAIKSHITDSCNQRLMRLQLLLISFSGEHGNESDEEEEDKDSVQDSGLPNEVSSELVVQHWNENEDMEDGDQNIFSTGKSPSATLEQLSGFENNGNKSESSKISDKETDFTIRKWEAKNELKRKQTQPKECTPSTTDTPQMKRRSQSNASSSSQNPTKEHPDIEEAESSKAKRATSSRASGNKKATKAPVKWTLTSHQKARRTRH